MELAKLVKGSQKVSQLALENTAEDRRKHVRARDELDNRIQQLVQDRLRPIF